MTKSLRDKASLQRRPSRRAATPLIKSSTAVGSNPSSKQSRVLELLRSGPGATIAGMMQKTGWQQHSVRGFLAGVVRKKLGLTLQSKKIDGERTYRIVAGAKTESKGFSKKRRA